MKYYLYAPAEYKDQVGEARIKFFNDSKPCFEKEEDAKACAYAALKKLTNANVIYVRELDTNNVKAMVTRCTYTQGV